MNRQIVDKINIFQCSCGEKDLVLNKTHDSFECPKCGSNYTIESNIIHFINNDDSRPTWSKNLEKFLRGQKLYMKAKYNFARKQYCENQIFNDFISSITQKEGIIIDLASGPSGYFAPILDNLKGNSVFVITDACPSIIKAHSLANKDANLLVLDVDLDKILPFKNDSVDAFSGNLLNNVTGYKNLLKEIYRSLKPGGIFAVIELFYEKGTETYQYLTERDEVYSSLETYLDFCSNIGFQYLNSEIYKEQVGKMSEGDLLPIGKNDKAIIRTAYFKK